MTLARTPMRTCIACRETRPQRELVRYRRRPDGVVVVAMDGDGCDRRRHATTWGRGAYVCPSRHCLSLAVRRHAFVRALGRAGAGRSPATVRSPESDVLWTETVEAVDAQWRLAARTSNASPPGGVGRRAQALAHLRQRLHQPGGSD